MNREILFKAKMIDNGEWVEGYIYEHLPPLQCIVPEDYEEEQSKWYICNAGFVDWNMPRPVDMLEVAPETVCQYTGRTDKNGKKIFDKHIVKGINSFHNCEETFICVWHDNGFYFQGMRNDDCFYSPEHINDMCVVGNVFDNPGMLKGGEYENT